MGNKGGKAKNLCNLKYIVPSNNVARIQETHIFLGHLIFELVEDQLTK
jgi:D-sedoheptulose 7-phosphate isomerase